MTEFRRRFAIDALEGVIEAPTNAWFRDLLKCWRPAGDGRSPLDCADANRLRLAVRDGYLNFYRLGQSVAKVRVAASTGKVRATIHRKYVFGERANGPDYVEVSEGTVTRPDGFRAAYDTGSLHEWIRVAGAPKYAKEEKRFVDWLVARDANVIDLEAGLPWDPDIFEKKCAKRIDLVALEHSDGCYKLVFWEAKLISNPEARSRTVPRVIDQLQRYQEWLAKHQSEVRDAYHATCVVLARLHAIAARYSEIPRLGDAILAVGRQDASRLLIDTVPRLIIDARKANDAFISHGHLAALQEKGIRVEMVSDAAAVSA